MRILLLSLILLSGCGKSDADNKIRPQFPDRQEEEETVPTVITPVEEDIDPSEVSKINDLLPTMYYTAEEEKVNCKGKYGNTTYDGTERTNIISTDETIIATVCTRFYRILLMEGSAILKDRGQGRIGVNYGGKIGEERRYHLLDRCTLGEGVRKDLCLLPYHTLATDNKIHAIGEIIYIPKARGIVLPDGTKHEGYFIVRDTGSAFTGVGAQRVDMFTGLDPDYDNTFQRAGFHHKNPLEAFKVKGRSADIVKERLKKRFGNLF